MIQTRDGKSLNDPADGDYKGSGSGCRENHEADIADGLDLSLG
jgi:hypothetical protein